MPFALQLGVVVGIVIISFAIFCAVFLIADSLHDRLSGHRRIDDAPRAQVNAPPPPHVSPFATPRARSETSPQVTAEGEVKT